MHDIARTPHEEAHFQSSETVRDVVIGLSDGLTVPFALAAGLSGAVASTHIVVLAGLAEIAAGSIAMGLGGYLAARGDAEHYASELERERREIVERTHDEEEEIYEIFEQYAVSREAATPVLEALKQNPAAWVDFMMRFELGLEEPAANRAHRSALTIALSYIAGGLVPGSAGAVWCAQGPACRHRVAAERCADGNHRRRSGGGRLCPGTAAQRGLLKKGTPVLSEAIVPCDWPRGRSQRGSPSEAVFKKNRIPVHGSSIL